MAEFAIYEIRETDERTQTRNDGLEESMGLSSREAYVLTTLELIRPVQSVMQYDLTEGTTMADVFSAMTREEDR